MLIKDCIKWDKSSKTMHRKVAIIDGCKVFIGSTNWTNNGFFENKEIDVLLHDTAITEKIAEQFNKDWADASDEYPLKQKEPEMPAPPDREDHYIGNKNPSSMKFHRPSCKYIHTIDEKNKVELETREEAQEKGFYPCGESKP